MARAKKKIEEAPSMSPLQAALATKHGNLYRAADRPRDVPTLPTLSSSLNKALGGGWALGRVAEVFGQESSGKTSLTLEAVAQAQRLYPERETLFVDVEHALDLRWAAKIGVDLGALLIEQPDSAEQALQLVVDALEAKGGSKEAPVSYAPSVIVVDSVAGLVGEAELAGEVGDATVAAIARLMSSALKKISMLAAQTGTLVLFINQERVNIQMGRASGKRTTGGEALKFYASQRCKVWGQKIFEGGKTDDGERGSPIGLVSNVTVVKNKVAPPFAEGSIRWFFDRGPDPVVELYEAALALGVIVTAGAWVKYTDPTHEKADDHGLVLLGQGRANALARLHADAPTRAVIEQAVTTAS